MTRKNLARNNKIRDQWNQGKYTDRKDLAVAFGLSETTIVKILKGEVYLQDLNRKSREKYKNNPEVRRKQLKAVKECYARTWLRDHGYDPKQFGL